MKTLTHQLSSTEAHRLGTLSSNLYCEFMPGKEVELVELISDEVKDGKTALVSSHLSDLFARFRASEIDILHISGLPHFTKLPPTPERYQPPTTADVHLQDVAAIVLSILSGGIPHGSIGTRDGRIINDVMPRPGFEQKANSAFGASKEFDWHTDHAYAPDNRPRTVVMTCFRNKEQGATEFLNPLEIINDNTLIAELEKPQFNIHYESSSPEHIRVRDTPVILPDRIQWYGSSKMSAANDHAESVLGAFTGVLALARQEDIHSCTLQAGDMVIWNNLDLVHKRLPFTPHMAQSNRRWLRRIYL